LLGERAVAAFKKAIAIDQNHMYATARISFGQTLYIQVDAVGVAHGLRSG
jgi:hypothetical protein